MASSKYEVASQTIEVLLSPDTAEFEVPPFQRTYSWGADEINQLFDDIFSELSNADLPYFLGSIVLASKEDSSSLEKDSILDGQQRLTTISLTIAALIDKLSEDGVSDVSMLKTRLFSYRLGTRPKPKITLQGDDKRPYEDLVKEPFRHSESKYRNTRVGVGLNKVYRAIEQVRATTNITYETMLERLLYSVEVVRITAPSEKDAFRLFETLNDRGLALSAADLIKNKLFSQCGHELEDAIDAWSEVVTSTKSDDVVNFLRYFWIAVHGFVRKRGMYDKYREYIDTLDATEATVFTIELAEAAKDYEQIIDPNTCDWGPEIKDALTRLNLYRARSCRPAILACRKYRPDDLGKVIDLCESVTVRYSIVGEKNPNRLEMIYAEICKALRNSKLSLAESFGSEPLSQLLSEVPSDDEFELRLGTMEISSISTAWREILVRINENLSTGETRIESPNRVQVEHILPQTPRATVLTESNLSMEEAASLISRLGNLTLWSGNRNREASNKPFSRKRDRYATSEIAMTSQLDTYEQWSSEQIAHRSKLFANLALDIYPHPQAIIY